MVPTMIWSLSARKKEPSIQMTVSRQIKKVLSQIGTMNLKTFKKKLKNGPVSLGSEPVRLKSLTMMKALLPSFKMMLLLQISSRDFWVTVTS
jgi:hypothetical protein